MQLVKQIFVYSNQLKKLIYTNNKKRNVTQKRYTFIIRLSNK